MADISAVPSCRNVLLPDDPATTDELGTHSRIAAAIGDVLQDDSPCGALALKGGWGSGKSTVVGLARGLLEKNPLNRMFVFDAWAHQGDSLRRAFVEELCDCLAKDPEWVAEATAQSVKDEISGRTDTVKSEAEPVLNRMGTTVSFLAYLAVPIAAALLGASFNARDDSGASQVAWMGVAAAFILFLVPVLAGLVIYGVKKEDKEWVNRGSGPIGALLKMSRVVTHTTTSRSPDPTSIEFASAFETLLTEAMNVEGRRLVVVMDNLDRIEPQVAIDMWATMRTFVDPGQEWMSKWRRRLWVVVPFDSTVLGAMWDKVEPGTPPRPSGPSLSSAFERKTFQAELRLPAPLLSDWKELLVRWLGVAMPDHAAAFSDDFDAVYRIFRSSVAKAGDTLTPRDIKGFINALGVQHRLWGHDIPLTFQALFVILDREKAPLSREHFNDPDLVPGQLLQLLGDRADEWQPLLASMMYNTADPEKAWEILIGDSIEAALVARAPGDLSLLQDRLGFANVCDEVITEGVVEWPPLTLASAAATLAEAGMADEPWLANSWRLMAGRAARIESWFPLEENVGEGIAAIVANAPESQRRVVFGGVLAALSVSGPARESDD